MIISDEATRALRDAFQIFAVTEATDGRPYPKQRDWQAVCERARRYGAPQAKSAYRRAIVELEREKVIQLRKPIAVPPPIPVDFDEQIRRLTSTELRVKLKDPAFGDLFGRWSSGDRPTDEVEGDEYANFSAAEWRTLPPSTACRLMNNPRFRTAIDRLTDKGEI